MKDFSSYIEFMCEKFESAGGKITWPKRVMAVLLRDEFTCNYCGEIGLNMTADHVIPLSRGGGDEMNNLVCACAMCNRVKSNKTGDEFRSSIFNLKQKESAQWHQ